MTWYSTRRAAVCTGALAISVVAAGIVVPAANADVLDPGGSVTTPAGAVTLPIGGTSTGGTSASTSSVANGAGSTATGALGTAGTVLDSTTGTSTGTTGAGSAGTMVDQATGAVNGTLDGVGTIGGTGVGAGTGGIGAVTGGGISVTVGADRSGGSLVDVTLGGMANGGTSGTGGVGGTTVAPIVAGGSSSAGGSGAAPSTTGSTARLLGLGVTRSLSTVYPAKDGYRDDVTFTLDGVAASGEAVAVDGTAVLRRGKTTVKRWSLARSDQHLQWDGRSGGRIVPGLYTLTAGATDPTGRAFTGTSAVKVSAKRLVASTAKVSALAISGTHRMLAAPRAGLDRGDVTVRVTTVASKVRGTQKLIFEKNGRRLVVAVKKGTHTSRAITVPKAFTSFTLKHTWKKGQVKLKAIRYTYSYQSLK